MNVFLGLIYLPEDMTRMQRLAKVGLESAANNFQWGILDGITENTVNRLTVINNVPMGTYPKYSRVFIEKERKTVLGNVDIINCGFINLPLIKQSARKRSAYKHLKNILKSSGESVNVILYSLYLPYLKAVKRLKKKYSFNLIIIVPDLIGENGILPKNPLKRLIVKGMARKVDKLLKVTDGYVLLTEQMKYPLNITNKPYVIVEGVYNGQNKHNLAKTQSQEKMILYTGHLSKELGIERLVKAFEELAMSDVKLVIAGDGAYKQELLKACERNSNIEYLGFVSKEQVEKLQSQATVLVNPRPSGNLFTKYSFPSKTMEYLASGKPVVMNRLEGIPSEYEEYLYYAKDDSVESLTDKLREVLSMDKKTLLQNGKKAREFILENKNGKVQAKKILDLIDSVK